MGVVVVIVVVVVVVVVVSPPPYQPPLLHTLLAHIRFTRYLQHFRHVGTSYEASKFTCEFSNSSFRFWTCILGEVSGERGDDVDILMQTPRTTSPEEPSYSVFSSTFVMSDHLT